MVCEVGPEGWAHFCLEVVGKEGGPTGKSSLINT